MSEAGRSEPGPGRPDWPHSQPLIHGDDDPLLSHLAACFPRARQVCIAVAFVLDQGVDLIRPFLVDLLAAGGELRLLTGDYFDPQPVSARRGCQRSILSRSRARRRLASHRSDCCLSRIARRSLIRRLLPTAARGPAA